MAAGEDRRFRKGERAYILNNEDLPFYVGEGLGDLDYDDAIGLSMISRTARGLPATQEYISAFAPPPERRGRRWDASQIRKGGRAYVLNYEHLPVYVGEGSDGLDYDDAVNFSIIERTALGLPATREHISAVAPPREKSGSEWDASQTSRASKNNPYICVRCGYKTTRCANMVTHLKNAHGDHYTDPRDNH